MGMLEDDLDYGLKLQRSREANERLYSAIQAELVRAEMHGVKFASAHEAYAVILEELDEFWEICRQKRRDRNAQEIEKELIQLGAMVIEAINSIDQMTGGKV